MPSKAAEKEYKKCRKTHGKKHCDVLLKKKKSKKTILDFDYDVANDIDLPDGITIDIEE